MTHEQLDPRDAEVRRLLAGARHTDPVPEDVVARLDRVLADLAAEPSRVRPVTDLATRRRRVTRLLVAAAAVVAVGVGVQQVVSPQAVSPQGGSDSASAPTTHDLREDVAADQGADSSGAGATASGEQAPEPTGSSSLDGLTAALPQSGSADLLRLRPHHFADDVAGHATFGNARGARVGGRELAFDAAGLACRADAWGRGTFVPVRYGRIPAVLVLRRALGDTRVADLFLCGDTEPTRSVTLPAP